MLKKRPENGIFRLQACLATKMARRIIFHFPSPTMKHLLQQAAGVLLMAFGAFMLIGFIAKASEGSIDGGDWGIFPILCIAPTALGGWLYRQARLGISARLEAEREQLLLRAAKAAGGKLTASELAMSARITLAEAERRLSELHTKGYVMIEHADNGAILYDFHELLSIRQKEGSQRMFD
jgi:hypothetical protein